MQIDAWKGKFGDEYTARHAAGDMEARRKIWWTLLPQFRDVRTVVEIGANIGLNLRALKDVSISLNHPLTKVVGAEPNESARAQLEGACHEALDDSSGLPSAGFDLAFTCGVLIHVEPDSLLSICREIHRVSKKYILSLEYFSDRPTQKAYRGETLFKRDYGQFWLDNFSDLEVEDVGFFWKPVTGLDNLTFWLFRK